MTDQTLDHVILRCRGCQATYPAALEYACSRCLGPLDPEYDTEALALTLSRAAIEAGPRSIWRYAPLLPASPGPGDLAPGLTPLVPAPRLAAVASWGPNSGRAPAGPPSASLARMGLVDGLRSRARPGREEVGGADAHVGGIHAPNLKNGGTSAPLTGIHALEVRWRGASPLAASDSCPDGRSVIQSSMWTSGDREQAWRHRAIALPPLTLTSSLSGRFESWTAEVDHPESGMEPTGSRCDLRSGAVAAGRVTLCFAPVVGLVVCSDDSDGGSPTTESSSSSRSTTTAPERPASTTTTAFDPASVEGAVEAAYLKSWDVYADAVYDLVLDEEALESVYAETSARGSTDEIERSYLIDERGRMFGSITTTRWTSRR